MQLVQAVTNYAHLHEAVISAAFGTYDKGKVRLGKQFYSSRQDKLCMRCEVKGALYLT